MYRIRRFARACAGLTLIALLAAPAAFAAHGYALWGELKYPPGFAYFDYVNADAPKGGELRSDCLGQTPSAMKKGRRARPFFVSVNRF